MCPSVFVRYAPASVCLPVFLSAALLPVCMCVFCLFWLPVCFPALLFCFPACQNTKVTAAASSQILHVKNVLHVTCVTQVVDAMCVMYAKQLKRAMCVMMCNVHCLWHICNVCGV